MADQILKIKKIIESIRKKDSTLADSPFVFGPHIRLFADELEAAINPWQPIEFFVWNGTQYVRNTMLYDFESFSFRNNSLQIFMREKPKPEDNTAKEKPK